MVHSHLHKTSCVVCARLGKPSLSGEQSFIHYISEVALVEHRTASAENSHIHTSFGVIM